MKKVFTLLHFCLLVTGASLLTSCEKEKLDDVLSTEQFGSASASLATKTEIGTGSTFTLTGGELTVPVTVNFSTATTRAFTVQLTANPDLVADFITSGALATGTLPITTGSFSIPTVLNVPIGVTSTTFDLVVSRSFLEVNYGKTVALAVKMSDPAKGNTIAQGKDVGIVTIKTSEAIAADAVHYIGFVGTTVLVPDNNNFTIGSQDLIIDLPLSLSGTAGPTFTVDVTKDIFGANAAIAANGGPTVAAALPIDRYLVGNGKVTFDPSKNAATLKLTTNFSQLMSLTDKKWIVALTLSNPSKYQTSATKKTIIVVIDGTNLSRPYIGSEAILARPYTGTPFVISGTIGKASEMIPAAIYDLGGEGVAFHDDGGKDGTTFRPDDKVDIGDYIPRSVVGWTNDNEWLTYTVNVEADGAYELNSIIGSNGPDGRYSIFFDGVRITDILAAKATPGAYGDQQPNYTTVNLKKGRHIFKFYVNVARYDVKDLYLQEKANHFFILPKQT